MTNNTPNPITNKVHSSEGEDEHAQILLLDPILKEAKHLYDLNFAVHWLKPKSKAPVNSGWSGPKRDTWETLQKEYRVGNGLGIRLGEASKLGDGYLAVIDLDIRFDDPRYYQEAIAVLDRHFPGTRGAAAVVATGRGFGSSHFYFLTKQPVTSRKLGHSEEQVKVFSPSSEITTSQRTAVRDGKLTEDELNQGYRMKKAWEVEFMSIGKQVVAPPTLHPDTRKPYEWTRGRS